MIVDESMNDRRDVFRRPAHRPGRRIFFFT
jgi:hypothetical protein